MALGDDRLRHRPGRGGYAYSFIFSQTRGDYRLLFLLGALSFLIALVVDLHLDRVPQQANADVRP